MLINHNTKQYWWGPMRTGSREVSKNLKRNGWVEVGGHHYMDIIEDYELWVSCRNPYSRAVSWWILRTKHEEPLIDQDGKEIWMIDNSTFKEWLMGDNEYMGSIINEVSLINDYGLRFRSIPLENIEDGLNKLIPYTNEGSDIWKAKTTIDIKEYSTYWDETLAEWFWERKMDEFKLFGYEKNSWRGI